jgi:hypothetical protein
MDHLSASKLGESFAFFEIAVAKGHEESIWILSVWKDMEMEKSIVKEAFAKTEKPLGWYLAGELSEWNSRERFDFYKRSAEGGCSWGQVGYGAYFYLGEFVEEDEKVHLEWLEKAANQNNPDAMGSLGDWFRTDGGDSEKAVSYGRAAAELGRTVSMSWLSDMFRDGLGCERDLRRAVIWGAKGDFSTVFWELLREIRLQFKSGTKLDCDFDPLCFSLGWGVYWYRYGSEDWEEASDEDQVFGNHCLDYYCFCIELQQKSIFTFLLFWNRTTGGVKGPGEMIAKKVWEGREDNLVKLFEWKDEGCLF